MHSHQALVNIIYQYISCSLFLGIIVCFETMKGMHASFIHLSLRTHVPLFVYPS